MAYIVCADSSAGSGFPSMRDIRNPGLPTLSLPEAIIEHSGAARMMGVQWLFPSMEFNCSGNITEWIFRATLPDDPGDGLPQFEVWRDHTITGNDNDYFRVAVNGREELLENRGNNVYAYSFQNEPIPVEEGYVFGVFQPGGEVQLELRLREMEDGVTPVSYLREGFATIFIRSDDIDAQGILPLVTAVIGKCA